MSENVPASREDFPGQPGRFVQWCLSTVLVFVVLVEIVAGRTELVWRLVPGSDVGTLLEIEEAIIRPNPDPHIIVMGTSRARGAFLPTQLEQSLGLRKGQVLNLAMGGAQIIDALVTYERNRAQLSKARLVIVQVDPFQFSSGIKPGFRFRHFASASDRLAYSGATRASLLLDMIFRTDHTLPVLTEYLRYWQRTGHAPGPAGVDQFGRLAAVRIADDHPERQFESSLLRLWIHRFYETYEYSPVFEEQLARLVRMVKADGGEVVLVGMPTAGDYWALMRESNGELYSDFKERLARLAARLGARSQFWDAPVEVGLTDRDFRDWGHLNTPGAIKWSDFVAGWIVQTGLAH